MPDSEFAEPQTFDPSPAEQSRAETRDGGRLAIFASIVLTIWMTANGVACATWSYFFGVPGWPVWQFIPDLLPVAFVASTLLGFRYSHPLLRLVYRLSAMWLGALNLAFFASIACWLIYGIARLAGAPFPRWSFGAAAFGIALAATGYGLLNATRLRIKKVAVHLPNLPEAWEGRSIALVSDLHLGHISGPRFLNRVIAQLRSLQPDAVCIAGDMFDGTPIELDRLVAGWREFSAPWGVFYATGNHDEFAAREIYLGAVRRTGIRILHNEKLSVHGLQLVGVHDSEAGDPEELRSILRRVQVDPAQASILLTHRPVNLSIPEEEGISLQLSGHTHSGQFWPWNLVVARIYGRFAYGLSRLGRLLVYTSSGAGTWGPPMRLGTQSEVVLLRLSRGLTGTEARSAD